MQSQTLKKMKLPDVPGVYKFISPRGKVLYIGRATSLRDRVRSYFSSDIEGKRGPAIAQMTQEADTVKCERTDSVLEALILEANLIKKFQPKYNVKEKDDKSFNYIIITKEDFPRVLLVRGRELDNFSSRSHKSYTPRAIFGPFPRGSILRDALKIVRKIFPFRDTCKIGQAKSCFNAQIGLCPGVCAGHIDKNRYSKIITNLRMFLGGKRVSLIKKLEREMKIAAKKHAFEEALQLKRTLFALKHIQDIALIKDAKRSTELQEGGMRIEGYDIAHMSGKAIVGVMTVVENGEKNPSQYRKFKIKSVKGTDDTASLAEVLTRRFGHPEWPYPRVIVVDGGVAQKNRAKQVLRDLGIEIPIVSVVKDEHHRAKQILGDAVHTRRHEKDILLVNAEAHRFALSYHRDVRSKTLFSA